MKAATSLSITARLALLFAAVTIATFAAVGTYLYQALAHQLERRDDMELIGKVVLVRHLLREAPSIGDIVHDPHPFLDSVFGHPGLIMQLMGPDGRVLLQSTAPSLPLPTSTSVPESAAHIPQASDVQSWQSAVGIGRLVRASGIVGQDEPASASVTIVIAREGVKQAGLLQDYGRNLFLAVGSGALLAAMFGFAVVRWSMRPLRSVIGKANNISTHRLNTRLTVEGAPTELRELGAAFNAMLDRLEDGVQRLSRFAADLAHDLRTPLNTLMVETQVALARPRSIDEYQALLVSNTEEYEQLARMIENTLFLARADNAQLALHQEILSTKTAFERICNYFEGLAEEAGVSLTAQVEDAGVRADPILFQRAVSNLVSNAISHTPRGGTVHVAARESTQGTDVSVENSGPGIAPEHLPHIFDRYYRADPARSAPLQSSGLGLAIVRAIMQLHGGEVGVNTNDKQHTVFFLYFR
jgi:two-component system heavy metal sensor histidine kinase CusS